MYKYLGWLLNINTTTCQYSYKADVEGRNKLNKLGDVSGQGKYFCKSSAELINAYEDIQHCVATLDGLVKEANRYRINLNIAIEGRLNGATLKETFTDINSFHDFLEMHNVFKNPLNVSFGPQ